jgi:predicted nucleic-acid-binding protein
VIAVDTNVLVRLLTNDDQVQARRAVRIMQRSQIFIPKTVMLETEWVLRHAYGIDRKQIRRGFQNLMGLPNVKTEDSRSLALAISWYGLGIDFADALHLASSSEAKEFVTFDKSLAQKANKLKVATIILP